MVMHIVRFIHMSLCVQSYVQKYIIIINSLLKAGNLSLVKEKWETDLIQRYFIEICFKYIYTKKKKRQFYLEKCITSSKEKKLTKVIFPKTY